MKIITAVFFLFILTLAVQSEPVDYEQIYRELEVADFSYVHDIDPEEYYDTMRSTWSPYPLFRLTSPLYFKTVTILPGYYLLTPRNQNGNWYILFKEAGRVKYIVPVYDRDLTPQAYYEENMEQPKETFGKKFRKRMLTFVGKNVPSSKLEPAPQTTLELTDLDNNFVSMVLSWGNYRYYMIFRTVQL